MFGYSILIFAISMSFICLSYDTVARQSGWPVGEILSKDASLPKIAAFITIVWALIKSFSVFQWWSPIVVLVGGWLLAMILTMVLRKNAQILGILGVFIGMVLTILYVSEDVPFGMLHNLV